MNKKDRERLPILFNPSSGKGKALKKKARLEAILKKLNIPYKLYVTTSEENLRFLTQKIAALNEVIVAVGGDTTINIIINEIKKKELKVRLGLIGLGSSNDIAREFVGLSLEKACNVLKIKRCKQVDLGVIIHEGQDFHYFLGQANIGLGLYVNRFVESLAVKNRWPGKKPVLAGVIGIIDAYRKKKNSHFLELTSGVEEITGNYVVGLISNIKFWATGMSLCPDSSPDDGLLEACFVNRCSFVRLAYIAAKAAMGKHQTLKDVNILRSSYFEVESDVYFEIQTDGEILTKNNKVIRFDKAGFKVLPGELSIFC